MTHDKKRKKVVKCDGLDHAKIDRRNRVGVIAQERPPSLRLRPAPTAEILGDRRLGDLEA